MNKPSAQQITTNIAKQTIHESNEFLRTAREQIAAIPADNHEAQKPKEQPEPPQENKQLDLSFLNNYKAELDEIRRESLFKELQQKIAEGEIVPLENYLKELSYEQREVLKAQMEAMKMRQDAAKTQQKQSLPQIISKRARGMMGTIKKRNEQHVETRQPPSG